MTERGKKIRETFLRKYGVEHPSQLPSTKEKIKKKRELGAYDNMIENMKKTIKEKYGYENYNNLKQGKKTKLEKYGDENYNNRPKMIQTNNERYGMNVSPNVIKSITERTKNNEIGFNSDSFKKYLKSEGVSNVSQIKSVKENKRNRQIQESIRRLFFGNRLKGEVIPLFKESEYKGNDYYYLYKFKCCKCNNEFEDTLYSGNIPRCLVCYPHNRFKSTIETDIVNFLILHNQQIKQHDRTILNGDEIDILLESKNIGIECDGIIWHSEMFGKKPKLYHVNKTDVSKQKNISLIHVWDWEWLNKKDLIKSMILNKIGKSQKIYAKKCNVKEITNSEKSTFLIHNHIQRDDKSSVKIGLYLDSELVSVMTFVKSRFDKSHQYEMSRYCNKLNLSVIGGASKMFSFFVKTYVPRSIVSYCDRRFFNGNVYLKLGMSFYGYTTPNYWYFNKNNCVPINRISFQKHKLKSILPIFDNNLSEWENMKLNGYDRIWDCGNLKFVWENTNKQFKHSIK